MNFSGFILIGISALIVIIGLRGTQGQVLPWFFSNSNPAVTTKPNSDGSCPTGYVKVGNVCYQLTGENPL